MIAVIICVSLSLALFTVFAIADKRWPDRLSRRGRFLAGLPVDALEAEPSRSSPPPSPADRVASVEAPRFGTKDDSEHAKALEHPLARERSADRWHLLSA
jgi:hypothetical protein